MKGKKLFDAEFQAWMVVTRSEAGEASSITNGGISFYGTRAGARIAAECFGGATVHYVTVQIFEHKRAK